MAVALILVDGGDGDGGSISGETGVAYLTPTSLAAVATKNSEKRSFIVPAHGEEKTWVPRHMHEAGHVQRDAE